MFKSGDYGSQSAGVQDSAKSGWVVLAVWTGAKSADSHIFVMIRPFGPSGPHPTSKGPEKRRHRLVRRGRRKKNTIFGDGRLDLGDGDVFRPWALSSGPDRYLVAF